MGNTIKTPFTGYRSEVTIESIKKYFVEPDFFDEVTKDRLPVLIEGERGTGKTTILRSLTIDLNYEKFINSQIDYWGVYHKFDLNIVTSFKGASLTYEKWRNLFGHYISTIMVESLIKSLTEHNTLFSSDEVDGIINIVITNYFEQYHEIENLVELVTYLRMKKLEIFKAIRNSSPSEVDISNHGFVFRELSEFLAKTDFFRNKVVYFLLDEYESLLGWQQKVINTYIKYADKNHTFVIGFKTEGMKEDETIEYDYIRQTDDYNRIPISSDISDSKTKKNYEKFVRDICRKRLKKHFIDNLINYNEKMLDIESYFGSYSFEDEIDYINSNASRSVSIKYNKDLRSILAKTEYGFLNKYSNRIFSASLFVRKNLLFYIAKKKGKLNDETKNEIINIIKNGSNYSNNATYENYTVPLIYLSFVDMRTERVLAGLDKIINVSGGVVRYFLEICDRIFFKVMSENEYFWVEGINVVNNKIQSNSIYDVSTDRLKDVGSIPRFGYELENLLRSVGNIFGLYHRILTVPKIEVNHFEVTQYDNEEKRQLIQKILRVGVLWGVFKVFEETKKTDLTKPSLEDKSYMIHPIYTPYFGISNRRKKNQKFKLDDVFEFSKGNSLNINRITNEILNRYKSTFLDEENQISLLLDDEGY